MRWGVITVTVPVDARPGDIVLIKRRPRQFLPVTSDLICWGTDSDFYHAAIYMGANLGLIEASPDGVRYAPADKYGDQAVWFTGDRVPMPFRPTDSERLMIAVTGKSMLGTPYGWPDIVAIALAQHRLHNIIDVKKAMGQQPWWVQRLLAPGTVICSQLVALAYWHAGIGLLPDRLPGLVSPGDLGRVLAA